MPCAAAARECRPGRFPKQFHVSYRLQRCKAVIVYFVASIIELAEVVHQLRTELLIHRVEEEGIHFVADVPSRTINYSFLSEALVFRYLTKKKRIPANRRQARAETRW